MSAILEALKRVEKESPLVGFQSLQHKVDPRKALIRRIKRLILVRRLVTAFLALLILGGGAWALVSYRPWLNKGLITSIEDAAETKRESKTAKVILENRGEEGPPDASEKKTIPTEPPLQTDREGTRSLPARRGPLKSMPRDTPPGDEGSPPSVRGQQGLSKGGDTSGFKLDALVWSSNPTSRFAVINGQIVRAGGAIEGASVTEIGRNYVALKSGNKTWELRIRTPD